MTADKELMDYCQMAVQLNQENLMMILSDNQRTEFGRQYHFHNIQNFEEYRKTVPLLDYHDFSSYIERMRNGEENILTVYPIVSYCRTSGSTGASKYIPLSLTVLNRYSDYFERWRTNYLHQIKGRRFLINSFRTDLHQPIAKTALFSEIYFRYLYENGFMDMSEYIGGEQMIFVNGEEDILYAKVREALASDDFRLLESQFLYELLGFFSFLEKNWRTIWEDMKQKSVPGHLKLSDTIRNYLNRLPVSEQRLQEIYSECRKGFKGIAKRLWKHLELVSGVSNRSYLTESAALAYYIGDIPKQYLCYCASECYIGTPVGINDYGYVMLPQNAFYEFLPYPSENNETVMPDKLVIGQLYEPVITNFSGLYRYRLGDIVKITGYIDESPVMEFMFRKGQALNVASEKYDMRQLENAVFSLRESGITVENYCVGACFDSIPVKYIALLAVQNQCEESAGSLFDKALCLNNPEYQDLRELRQLDAPTVLLCDGNVFSEFMRKIGLKHQHGHNKPHHIVNGEVSETEWKRILQNLKSNLA